MITTDLSYEGRFKVSREGPYSRCVWKCNSNVPEVQEVFVFGKTDSSIKIKADSGNHGCGDQGFLDQFIVKAIKL